MSSRTRLFLILWIVGLVGVSSLLLIDVSAVISMLPIDDSSQPVELPPPILLKTLTVFQPAVLITLATLIGVLLADRLGLHAPAAEAAAAGKPFLSELRSQLPAGILSGFLAGSMILLAWVIAKPFLAPDLVSRAMAFNKLMPVATRFLYGGLTEEVLLRWGLMTFFVWLPWRIFQKGIGEPGPLMIVSAIFVSAVVFGVGHLPVASLLAGGLTFTLAAYVITANSLFGIVAGFLYWRRGLESAMIAHITAHVLLLVAVAFSL